MADPSDRARALRRRHQQERQAVVFGSLVAGLAVAGLAAVAIYTKAIDPSFLNRPFFSPSPTAAGPALPSPPCPPDGTMPVSYDSVSVTVMNSSDRAGLAGQTADTLAQRGFTIASKGNYPTPIDVPAEVLFGEAGLPAAYTLAAQIQGVSLVLDTRTDDSVELVLGPTFVRVLPAADVTLDPEAPLVGVPGCVALDTARAHAVPGPEPSPTPTDTPTTDATDAPAEGAATGGG
jgi:hypothetical protein